MGKIIECVPNFSEGRDRNIIKQITDSIEQVEGVRLLHVDMGAATNRTVVTFVGNENAVVQAAYNAIKKAAELIDMRHHKGEHPRIGATDVCPFIPVANASMEDCIKCATQVAQMVGEELGIPMYLYENAATAPHRKNLASIRAGEYEGIAQKILQPEWKPDYGPAKFNERSGSTVIGARNFLVAYNVNLNTTSTRRANSVAFDVREQGRKVKDENGIETVHPGSCKSVKAIGWFIEEYGVAQVSMNLTDINITPVHIAFDECVKSAFNRGMRVTGSELVGLIPLSAMLDAGRYFQARQQRSIGVSEEELIKIAIKSLGLDELTPFNPHERIIEYVLKAGQKKQLVQLSLSAFANETASESPAPGGGSIAAYLGALGASLGTMVANLSSHKKGWDHRWEFFSNWAVQGQQVKDELLKLVDEDTNAFNGIMSAFALPKGSDAEKTARKAAIQQATRYAIEIPLRVMETAYHSFGVIRAMAEEGNPNSVSDAGVGALCARSAVYGAYLNVCINAAGYNDEEHKTAVLSKANDLLAKSLAEEQQILHIVMGKI
jgi:glutamate formiminotransferase/formiminotetrahydrofolate cyclodeaminase